MTSKANTIEVGDKIQVQGITVEVASVQYQFCFDDGIVAEFTDTNDIYRNWKQRIDGGTLIKKHS